MTFKYTQILKRDSEDSFLQIKYYAHLMFELPSPDEGLFIYQSADAFKLLNGKKTKGPRALGRLPQYFQDIMPFKQL